MFFQLILNRPHQGLKKKCRFLFILYSVILAGRLSRPWFTQGLQLPTSELRHQPEGIRRRRQEQEVTGERELGKV